MSRLNNLSIAQNIIFFTIIIVLVSLVTVTLTESLSFTSSTTQIIEDSSKEINKQVIMNYENYIDSVIDTANYIQQETTEYGLRNQNYLLDEIYASAVDIEKDIETILLLNISGEVVVSSTTQAISSKDFTTTTWYINALTENTIYHFSSPHRQDTIRDSREQVITVTKRVDYYVHGQKQSGILVVDINTDSFISLSDQTNLGDGGHIVILNSDSSLVFSNKTGCYDITCDSSVIVREIIIGGEFVEVDETYMYANVNTLSNTRWRIGTFINVEVINQTQRTTIITSSIIFIVTMVVTIGLSIMLSRRISKPVYTLQHHMKHVEKGDFRKQIEIKGQKEIVDLGHSFNKMQEEIGLLMDTVLREQKQKRETELTALQTQINPHFLYNTLDSIVYLSENEKNEAVQEMVVALSRFFRISISKGKTIITLKEELEHAKNYLLIQKIRYNEKFDFTFEVEDGIDDLKMLKLVLQPLIENAIYHGISTEYDSGHIFIRAFTKEDKLVLEVEDDGYGINDDKIAEMYENMKTLDKPTSVGLRNVYQRLQIYYGEETDFIIESELDEKTVIRLLIPIERAK